MLAQVSQPKPFEGYRRQPQPHVSSNNFLVRSSLNDLKNIHDLNNIAHLNTQVPLTFPQYGDVTRQSKSVTLTYHPDNEGHELVERKDTKRSDPQYYSHIEPDASASDPNHQQHSLDDDATATTNDRDLGDDSDLVSAHNHTHNSFSVVNSDNNNNNNEQNHNDNNEYSQHNISHNSYEKFLKPHNVYIPNLPKVINTVSVSVSDQNGKKLNLSLENIWADQQKNGHQRSYDDYKEDEISAALLEPFFLDVPKLTNRNKQNINHNNSTR